MRTRQPERILSNAAAVEKRKNRKGMFFASGPLDMPYVILLLLLLGTGLITMYSASYAVGYYYQDSSTYFIIRQLIFAVIGLAAMYAVSFVRYQTLSRWALPATIVSFILLALVFTPLGVTRNQARRWLNLGVQFQPSELAKIAIIVCFATLATAFADRMKTFKYGMAPFLCIIAVYAALLYKQPHLSATIIIAGTGIVIIFVAGASLKWLFGMAGMGVLGAIAFIFAKPYAMTRIKIWLDPFIDPLDKGWQGVQSQLAIGSGGFFGLGLGQSRQKHLYLPEPANDFIFSVICEELGFIGAMLIIIAFAAFIIRGYQIAMRAPDKFGCLLATGITTQIAIQTIVNICVVSGIMPITGAALPFFSYGGTSLFILLAEVGIVLSVSRQIPASKQG